VTLQMDTMVSAPSNTGERKVVWYSDFDGVYNISCESDGVTFADISPTGRYLASHNRIHWNPEVISLMKDVYATGVFDFEWHTTWNDLGDIQLAAEVMGVPELSSYSLPNFNDASRNKRDWTQWKAEHIIADQKRNPRPFIWVDDEAPKHWEDYVRGHTRSQSLIISPRRMNGLRVQDIVRAIDWTMGL
jgi:hypothetical protein